MAIRRKATQDKSKIEGNELLLPPPAEAINVYNNETSHEPTDIRGDRANIGILFFLYVLQGI